MGSRDVPAAGLGLLCLPLGGVENSSLLETRFGNENSGNNGCTMDKLFSVIPERHQYNFSRQVPGYTEATGKVLKIFRTARIRSLVCK